MALTKFQDAAGREAWLDTSTNMVFTEGGKNPTNYTKDAWNARQIKKYGAGGTKATSVAEKTANDILSASKKAIEEQTSYLSKYVKKNPFAFDEALAESSAKAEYEPYYTELLQDYVKGIDLSKETVQTERKLQQELQSYETGKRSREYTQAVAQAEEGFAGSGLFFSGIKNRALGTQEVEKQAGDKYLQAGYSAKEAGFQNTENSLALQGENKQRDLARQQEEAVQAGILTRQNEQSKSYYNTLIQDYSRKFAGNTSSSALSGYVPQDFLRY
jgi:hypothetical protein